jgi:hypothetical protein
LVRSVPTKSDRKETPIRVRAEWALTPSLGCPAYNVAVPAVRRQYDSAHKHQPIYATETSGLLVIAFLLLVLIVVRYWHAIHWSLR